MFRDYVACRLVWQYDQTRSHSLRRKAVGDWSRTRVASRRCDRSDRASPRLCGNRPKGLRHENPRNRCRCRAHEQQVSDVPQRRASCVSCAARPSKNLRELHCLRVPWRHRSARMLSKRQGLGHKNVSLCQVFRSTTVRGNLRRFRFWVGPAPKTSRNVEDPGLGLNTLGIVEFFGFGAGPGLITEGNVEDPGPWAENLCNCQVFRSLAMLWPGPWPKTLQKRMDSAPHIYPVKISFKIH